jgi:hypothetical protein
MEMRRVPRFDSVTAAFLRARKQCNHVTFASSSASAMAASLRFTPATFSGFNAARSAVSFGSFDKSKRADLAVPPVRLD